MPETPGSGCAWPRASADVRNLFSEIVRHLGAVGFVLGKLLRADGGLAAFEDGGDIVRLEVAISFFNMLWKMKTASVDRPALVRIGGAPLRARAW